MTYHECIPPRLNLIFKIKQEENFGLIEIWPNLISTLEDTTQCYVMYKGVENQVCQLLFEEGCLIYKKSFKIMYTRNHDLTAIHLAKVQNKKQKNCLQFLLGYNDGTIQSFERISPAKTNPLNKLSHFSFENQNKPVTGLQFKNNRIFICFLYGVVIIDNEEVAKSKSKTIKLKNKSLPERNKHNLFLGQGNQMFIYSEINGLFKYNLPSLTNEFTIEESVRVMASVIHQQKTTLFIGGTDNKLKLFNYQNKSVHFFKGYKSFISAIAEDKPNQRVWVGCLDGTLSCFRFRQSNQQPQKYKQQQIKKPQNILIQEGISRIFVHGRLLIVKDIQQNLYFFDIIDE